MRDEAAERNFQRNLDTLVNDIEDSELDRLIIQLQFMRAKRKRQFQSRVTYGFCDRCVFTYPGIYGDCPKCDKPLRFLPIRAEYSYLLDGEPNKEDGGTHFVTIKD